MKRPRLDRYDTVAEYVAALDKWTADANVEQERRIAAIEARQRLAKMHDPNCASRRRPGETMDEMLARYGVGTLCDCWLRQETP